MQKTLCHMIISNNQENKLHSLLECLYRHWWIRKQHDNRNFNHFVWNGANGKRNHFRIAIRFKFYQKKYHAQATILKLFACKIINLLCVCIAFDHLSFSRYICRLKHSNVIAVDDLLSNNLQLFMIIYCRVFYMKNATFKIFWTIREYWRRIFPLKCHS